MIDFFHPKSQICKFKTIYNILIRTRGLIEFIPDIYDVYLVTFFFYTLIDDDNRRPGQRPTTAMLGNEIMNKEQLYDLFQQILNVKKFEHQLLYNAMQVKKFHMQHNCTNL